jgi:CDP-glucose 4,6-dehydratase
VEGLVASLRDALHGKRVFVTGHTGFKGSWLLLWLRQLGAHVTGYALPAADPSMYGRLALDESCSSIIGDVRDRAHLANALESARPDVVFHLAAQSLVLASYDDPLGTIQTNIVGTANLLDALRTIGRPCSVVIVTSDKCYENRGWVYGYRETDGLGGHDVYSMSKAAAELVTASYRRSFFAPGGEIRVASARAGNVIGGGDWAAGRIVPDCMRALERGEPIRVRNPAFIRPWQHVLEPLAGYLMLASRLVAGDAAACDAWNFAPEHEDARSVSDLVTTIVSEWGTGEWVDDGREQPHEAHTLRLTSDKARALLGWKPRWSFATAVHQTVEWYRTACGGATADVMGALSISQIDAYARSMSE